MNCETIRRTRPRPRHAIAWRAIGLSAATLLLATAAACATGAAPSPPASPTGATSAPVHGIVLLEGGPYDPAAATRRLPGGFGTERLGRPYRFVVVRVTALDGPRAGRVVARVRPAGRALFTLALPAGTYAFDPLVPRNGPFPLRTRVIVRPGATTRAIVRVEAP